MIDVELLIRQMIGNKRSKGIVPENVPLVDLRNRVISELNNELNSLYKSGKIKVYKTCNDKAIELNG